MKIFLHSRWATKITVHFWEWFEYYIVLREFGSYTSRQVKLFSCINLVLYKNCYSGFEIHRYHVAVNEQILQNCIFLDSHIYTEPIRSFRECPRVVDKTTMLYACNLILGRQCTYSWIWTSIQMQVASKRVNGFHIIS